MSAGLVRRNKVNDVNSGIGALNMSTGLRKSAIHASQGSLRSLRSYIGESKSGFNKQQSKPWIPRHINKRECFRFVEDPAAKKTFDGEVVEFCCCGRARHDHHIADSQQQDVDKWAVETCTMAMPTDAFGEIHFAGTGHQNRSKYVRVSSDTDPKTLLDLFFKKWKMEVPNLVISVTGGAKSFHMKPRLKSVFRRGLMKAATSTGAWIITGGTNTGVMKHVGEAVKEQRTISGELKVNVLGIATWGYMENKEVLVGQDGEGMYPAIYRMEETNPNAALLDLNHTHFILVDDGTVGKFGAEIDLRTKIEEALSKLQTDSNSEAGSIGVPTVVLVLEGGPNTIKTMFEGIKKRCPAVVVAGSGRAADVVAFAHKHTVTKSENGLVVSVIDPLYEDEVKDKVVEVFGARNRDNVYKMIEEVLHDDKMITIYQLDDESSMDIDKALLTALLKANRSEPLSQLKLALAWNRADIAKSEIFTEDKIWKASSLHGAMFSALVDDKVEFVKLFVENGVSIQDFLNVEILTALYNSVPDHSIISMLLVNEKKNGIVYLSGVGRVIEKLMGDKYNSPYLTNERYYFRPKTAFLQKGGNELESAFQRIQVLPSPHLNAFIWSILCNRQALAKLFWERSHEQTAAAIMACSLLRGMAYRARKDDEINDISVQLYESADEFENLAIGVLDECHDKNEILAQLLLVYELEHFGNLTCFELAYEAKCLRFIAQVPCQSLISKLWKGDMSANTPWWKVIVCIIFPIFIYPWIYFTPDEKRPSQKLGGQSKADFSNLESTLQLPNDQLYNSSLKTSSSKQALIKDSIDVDGNAIEMQPSVDVIDDEVFGGENMSCMDRVLKFYAAPFTKYMEAIVAYIVFLYLYGWVITMHFPIDHVSIREFILFGWVFTLLVEELRQIASQPPRNIGEKITIYFASWWNLVDVVSLGLFFVVSVLRIVQVYSIPNNWVFYQTTRILYILDIIPFLIRSLQIFSVNRQLGPKLVMIFNMLNDLMQFVLILAVFVFTFGITAQAALFPNTESGWQVIIGVINRPYWHIYGELFLEDYEKNQDFTLCGGDGQDPCMDEAGQWVVLILLAAYMIMSNILLLNLLIAIFNYTFERVQEDSDQVWKFQRYDLVQEYHSRPLLAPPFILLSHLYMFIVWIIKLCKCCKNLKDDYSPSSMKYKMNSSEIEQLEKWEFDQGETFIYQSKIQENDTLDSRVISVSDRIDSMANQLERIVEVIGEMESSGRVAGNTTDAVDSQANSYLEKKVQRLEDHIVKTNQSVESILKLLTEQASSNAVVSSSSNSDSAVAAEKKKKKNKENSSSNSSVHFKSRVSPYTSSTVQRSVVPDDKVPWEVNFPDYKPVTYTNPVVLNNPPWADVDLIQMKPSDRPSLPFNGLDAECNVNRVSHIGSYQVVDKIPLNPMGRTGLCGRGLLGRWGPNHAADPIVTRWKMTSSGVLIEDGKRVLEFVAILRKDNQQWAIPGGMVNPGQFVSQTLKAEFGEEAMAKLDVSPEERERIVKQIEHLFQRGQKVYKGYVDDPRNTDNAWMETVAVNFHDETGDIFGCIKLQAGDDAQAVRWQRVSGNIPLYASHASILEKVAEMHGAFFKKS